MAIIKGLIFTLVSLSIFYFATHSKKHFQSKKLYQTKNGSRDFVAWLKTVPKDEVGNTGLKSLIFNMNPSVSYS